MTRTIRKRGEADSPEYKSWCHARSRCCNPNDPKYPSYGQRGITMCPTWIDSYATFLTDMGRRPTREHSIERQNNDGPYSKANCCWATPEEQANNRRSSVWYDWNGDKMTLAQVAKVESLEMRALWSRINKRGQSLEVAVSGMHKRKMARAEARAT